MGVPYKHPDGGMGSLASNLFNIPPGRRHWDRERGTDPLCPDLCFVRGIHLTPNILKRTHECGIKYKNVQFLAGFKNKSVHGTRTLICPKVIF
jgi:hypothetical protein